MDAVLFFVPIPFLRQVHAEFVFSPLCCLRRTECEINGNWINSTTTLNKQPRSVYLYDKNSTWTGYHMVWKSGGSINRKKAEDAMKQKLVGIIRSSPYEIHSLVQDIDKISQKQ